MRSFNNSKQIGSYSVLSKCVRGLFSKEESICTSNNTTLLDNLLESNNLARITVPGDGKCCFLSVAWGLKELTTKNENDPLIVHLKIKAETNSINI